MNRKNKMVAGVAAILLAAGIAVALAAYYAFSEYGHEAVRVNIPDGLTKKEVAEAIRQSDLGRNFGSRVACIWGLMNADPAKAHGSYLVSPGDRVVDVARRISNGRQTPVRFTFNNMRRFSDLAARSSSVMEFDSAAFMNVADTLLRSRGFVPATYAAAVLPDTYEFYWTAAPEKVLGVLVGHRDTFWNQSRLDKARRAGLTPVEVQTVASIVEEESNKADEHPVIARLYLNRLAKGMPLQADPTVKFAVGDFGLRRIGHDQIVFDSPYNTYINRGLPPGPIRIVEGSTIDAVLDAPRHSYLYMCARPDFSGYHDFTDTYARHRINAARYHRALNARGIKQNGNTN